MSRAPYEIGTTPPRLMLESPQAIAARSAVVPTTYERAAWNTIQAGNPHHQELPHHDSRLTAEQAREIEKHFDIELHFGRHSFGTLHKPPGTLNIHGLPTQREYDAALHIVSGLQEGDTLFVEARGFSEQPPEPVTIEQMARLNDAIEEVMRQTPKNIMEMSMLQCATQIGRATLKLMGMARVASSAEHREQAALIREGYLSSTWTYARLAALAKGIRVRYADYDRFNDIKVTEHTGKTPTEQMMAPADDISTRLQFLRDARRREKVARNALKDWAVDNLPPAGTPPPTGRKPKLVLLFGIDHRDSMIQAFKDMGLTITVHDMEKSTDEERTSEHLMRDMQELLPKLSQLALQTSIEALFSIKMPAIKLLTATSGSPSASKQYSH